MRWYLGARGVQRACCIGVTVGYWGKSRIVNERDLFQFKACLVGVGHQQSDSGVSKTSREASMSQSSQLGPDRYRSYLADLANGLCWSNSCGENVGYFGSCSLKHTGCLHISGASTSSRCRELYLLQWACLDADNRWTCKVETQIFVKSLSWGSCSIRRHTSS